MDTRQEPTKLEWFFLFSWIVSDKRFRKMMITRIVSMKFSVTKHTIDISRVESDWLALSQQASEQNAVQMTENGL